MRTRLATARGRDESHLVSRLAKIFAAGTALAIHADERRSGHGG